MIQLVFLHFCILLGVIRTKPIQLKSYSEIELPKGYSEYIYKYTSPYNNTYIKIASSYIYIFIYLSDSLKIRRINGIIEINGKKTRYFMGNFDENDKWIIYKEKNIICNYTFIYQFNTTEKTKIKFLDSTRILNMNLKQFLNLNINNINTNVFSDIPYPLLFNIKSDSNIVFSVERKYNYPIYNKNYILNYCNIEENNKCQFIGTDNIYLIKNNNYIFKLNFHENKTKTFLFRDLDKTSIKEKEIINYFFQEFKINYYIEEIYMKNNTFTINNFTRNNYLLLDIKNLTNISFYLDDNSGFLHQYHEFTTLSKNNWNDFINQNNWNNFYYINYINNSEKYNKLTNGKITNINNTLNDDYLLIRLNDNNQINKEGFILVFNEVYKINEINWSKEFDKNTHSLLNIKSNYESNFSILSSKNNLKLLFKSNNDDFSNKIILNNTEESLIYINSSQEKTLVICQFFDTNSEFYNIKLITQDDINHILNRHNSDNFFIRKIYNNEKKEFFSYYFLNIQEKYYVYNKKYFGIFDLYKYKEEINNEFYKPISYYDERIYENVTNKLFILNGNQFFNYYINYGAFFDFLIQKVNDNNYIDINKDMNNYSKSFFKLINPNKNYYIKSELNHLIKLDNNFLDAEIIIKNKNGIKYILNKDNKILDLVGSNFTLESNKLALIYFYEKIKDIKKSTILEFNKYCKGKDLEVNITNKNDKDIKIAIAKDFGFKDCYPIIDFNSLEIYTIQGKKSINLHFENYYDLLETDIYNSHDENYYIYIFEVQNNNKLAFINKNNVYISNIEYYDSLTKYNKYNFNIIPKGTTNLILKLSKGKKFNSNFNIKYQFVKCSNDDIKFNLKIINPNKNLITNEKNIISTNILLNKQFDGNQELIHYFESKNKFLFLYFFTFKNYTNDDKYNRNENYGIKYLNFNNKKNSISVGFIPVYFSFSEYYIIITKKNELNNLYSFSNPCYLIELINNHADEICIKKVYHNNTNLIIEEIDISNIKQNDESDEYIINIISNDLYLFQHFDIYTPIIYNEKNQIMNAKKINFYNKNEFIPEKDYFIYKHLKNEKQILHIDICLEKNDYTDLVLILARYGETIKKYYLRRGRFYGNNIEIILEKKGIYFLYFIKIKYFKTQKYYFTCYLFNKMIENIDFTKNHYFGFLPNYENLSYSIKDLAYYKINNFSDDKKVYFISEKNERDKPKEFKYITPFIICENEYDECININDFYYFIKGKNYTIYINLTTNYPEHDHRYFYSYSFFPATQNKIENITNEGNYVIDSPKIFLIEENQKFYFVLYNIKVYFVTSKGVSQLSSLYMKAMSSDIDDNDNYIYRFYIEKYYQYRTIILIPEENNKLKQIFISRKEFEQSDQIEIDKQENGIIRINDLNEKRRNIFQFLDNYFMIFNSNLENLRFIYFDKITKNKKLVFNHYGPEYLYCERNEKDKVIINETLYQPKFVLFSILNDETIESFKTFLESNNIYMNKRINTNNLIIYDLINIYIDNFDIKYNLYIKKYYGSIQLYESEYELNDINKDINILTKPINNLKNKKSIFNRLIQLNKNKLITGYISDNSLLDIYLEKDNDNKDIYLSDFKNRKYLKKGIEYQIHFNLNHLIKLECLNDNTEIIIYNEDIKIILDNKNQTGIVFGNNFKIKSNNNAMIYFYPKTEKFQIKLNPKKDEFIQIKLKNYEILRKFFSIDFGFEGYEPPDMSFDYPSEEVYIENLYNKLETKLAKGEYLYLYYSFDEQDIFEINYINNIIITSKFKYNFNILKANKAERKLIIPNINTKKIRIKINKCNSQANNNIKIYYKNDFGDAVEVKEKKNIYLKLILLNYLVFVNLIIFYYLK